MHVGEIITEADYDGAPEQGDELFVHLVSLAEARLSKAVSEGGERGRTGRTLG